MLRRPPRRTPPLGPPRPNARERILAAWRGPLWVDSEKAGANRAKPASAIMPKVLQTLRIDKRQSETEIIKVWNNLIDPTITAHAQPTGIHKGTLFVSVDSDVWRDEIVRYRRQEILLRLQHAFGRDLIQRISFRTGG
jgi:predicted nucleic acid-binding Zn ribbon protein